MNKKRLAWGGYLLALHLGLAALVLDGQVAQRAAVRVGLLDEPDWPGIVWMRDVQQQIDPQVPAGAVIFLGDSITQGLATAAVAPNSVNYGITGQRSDQLLQSMDRYASMARASAVVVMVGTNDLQQGREQGIEERYRAVLRKVPASVQVVLSGVPPMAGKDARPLVEASRLACAADARCRFVDAGITADMLTDGVHLNAKGYAVWAGQLRNALQAVTGV